MNKLFKAVLLTGLAVGSVVGLNGCGESEPVLAKVGNKSITQAQFDAFLQFKRVDTNNAKLVESQLNHYLDREALAAAIEQTNVLDSAKVEAELAEFKKEMLISRYFETFLQDKITDSAIRNYYAANADKYQSKKAKVAHILIRTHANIDETERKAKYTLAHQAYSQVMADGDFSKAAAEFSQDSISANKGGEIGWLSEGAIDPVFSAKVFNELKRDQISEPFQSNFGFHIVKVLEGPTVLKKPLESVVGDIRHQLRKEAKQAELERLSGLVAVNK